MRTISLETAQLAIVVVALFTFACCGGSEDPTAARGAVGQGAADGVGGAAGGGQGSGGSSMTGKLSPLAIVVEATGAAVQNDVPITFGQVFSPGEVPAGMSVAAEREDGAAIALQIDEKATHADGSLRHAIFSTTLASLEPATPIHIELVLADERATAPPIAPSAIIANGFSAEVALTLGATRYTASANAALEKGAFTTWLSGSQATEWIVPAQLVNAAGTAHPQLMVYFNIRAYGANKARVSVVVENNWLYVPGRGDFTYDATIKIAASTVYSRSALTHYMSARWRQVLWWNRPTPETHIKHDVAYLKASQAIPNFDASTSVPEKTIVAEATRWSAANYGPMDIGFATQYMPQSGAHPDIGPLPRWTLQHLLSMDSRAAPYAMTTDALAGSWSVHLRDEKTGLPLSLQDRPNLTTHSNLTNHPGHVNLRKGSATPHHPDTAHQPAFSFVPYLLTGDYYHLEELQFWTMYNTTGTDPVTRGLQEGLITWQQVRGQAWALRTLGQAAYITPDAHALKQHLRDMVQHNIDHYNKTLSPQNSDASPFHINPAHQYNGGRAVSTWQDGFWSWSLGYLHELGFVSVLPSYKWKAWFIVARMTDPGYCWIMASPYYIDVIDDNGDWYANMGEIYRAMFPASVTSQACGSQAMADALTQWKPQSPWSAPMAGQMIGYAGSPSGYVANSQPGLALAVDSGIADADKAWRVYRGRANPEDYSSFPNFGVVPRKTVQ